jgi:hypothetical protein
MTEKWGRYKSAYERYLRPEAVTGEEEFVGSEDLEQTQPIQASDNSDSTETSTDEPPPSHDAEEREEPLPDESAGSIWESGAERNE